MNNPYRLRSSDLFIRLDDGTNDKPRRIVFLSVEGNETEVDYFRHLDRFGTQLGINAMVRVEVIRRSNNDTRSDPWAVFALLEEMVDLHDNGADVSRFAELLPDGYDIDFVRTFLLDPDQISLAKRQDFLGKMQGRSIDIAYFRFVSECDERDDSFCVLLDKDSSSHSSQQLNEIWQKCREKGYGFYLSSPCFEFWLLLHLCDVQSDYANKIGFIRHNPRISNRHTFLSYEVSRKARHAKRISETVFRKEYLPRIDYAIKQSHAFETDVSSLISSENAGTNIADLVTFLRQ